MLKTAINITDLPPCENLDFQRIHNKRAGTEVWDKIGCKLRGMSTVTGSEASASDTEDWNRVMKILGCEIKFRRNVCVCTEKS